MKIDDVMARLDFLEDRIRCMEDIEEIKKLQRSYGYYLEHGMFNEIIDLFSENTESIETGGTGVYLGKDGVRKHFSPGPVSPEWLHIAMQISGIVDIDSSGTTAKARWYGLIFRSASVSKVTRALLMTGIYENEYIKEDGKWRFKKVQFYRIFATPWEDGWVKTPELKSDNERGLPVADKPPSLDRPYPSGYVFPFHYKNPITGK